MFYRFWKPRKRDSDPEPPPVGNRDRQWRGLFAGVPLIFGLVIITVLALLLFLHSRFMGHVGDCRAGYSTYPNVQVIDEQQPYFLQPFGTLRADLYSSDSPDAVEAWLNRARAEMMREAMESGDFSSVPSQSWRVTAANGGSEIVVYCP